ncbi:MAG: hypothetical protein CVU73_11955 [Deltaproteobacteria bacterium HGW-Deltaproteobacteria-8]|jgi:PAS domain S-box-containing protein|nr:MAG: hypothetical protein CVU73_11955 [Deltaproteobacteria bacterium HGW-Deltaproteobacteria-8]
MPNPEHNHTSPGASASRFAPQSFLAPVIVLAVCLTMAVAGWRYTDQLTRDLASERFENRVSDITVAVEGRVAAYELALRGGLALLNAVDDVSRVQWRDYVGKLNLPQNYPGIQGMGYATVVPPELLQKHIETLQRQGFPDYAVRPPGERAVNTAIIYLEPFDARNKRAFGYDMFSEPTRRAAMERTRDTGQTSITGRVTLVQETTEGVQAGFLMYLPFYAPGAPLFTDGDRRAALRGYVYSPFRMNNFMQGIIGKTISDLGLEVHDGTAKTEQTLMFHTQDQAEDYASGRRPMFTSSRGMTIFGRTWTLTFHSLPFFEASLDRNMPLLALIAGVCISLLLFFIALSLLNTRNRALALADTMTAELRESEEHTRLLLESTGEPIYGIDTKGLCTFCNPACLRVLGYTAPEDLLGKNMHQLIHHTRADGSAFDVHDCRIFQAFQLGQGTHVDDEVLWRADGTSFLAEYWSYPQRRDDEIIGAVVTFQDITARIQAEHALRESQARLAAVLDTAVDAIFTVNQFGRIRTANQAACRTFGYGLEELVDQNVNMLMPEPYHSQHNGFLERYARTGVPRIVGKPGREVPGRRKDGEIIPLELAVSEIPGGAQRNYTGILRDISERVRAREDMQAANAALAKGEDFLKAVTNNIPGLVGYWNADLRCEFANNAYLDWFGKPSHEVVGMTMQELLGPDLFARNEKFVLGALRGDPQHFERVLTMTDGSQHHTLAHYIPDDHDGHVHGFFVLVNDVTELKSAQLELEDRQRLIDADMEAAAEIQRSLLPKKGTCSLGLETAFRFMPSTVIGGDIFNVVCLGAQHSGLYMIDVSGHGVPAALVSVTLAQELSPSGDLLMDKFFALPRPPEAVLRLLDSAFPLERFDKFFSMFYMLYEIDSGMLTYCNAGHPAPMLLRAGGVLELLEEGGTLVGLGLGHDYVQGKVEVQEGDMLLVYTDGVSELESPEDVQFSAERLEELFRSAYGQNPEQVLQLLTGRLQDHADGRPPDDDISLVCVRFSRA